MNESQLGSGDGLKATGNDTQTSQGGSSNKSHLDPSSDPSKYQSKCKKLAQTSFRCLEKHFGDKTKCQGIFSPCSSILSVFIMRVLDAFDTYKACIKEEHTAIIQERQRRTQGSQ
jgi:hypothetical protein